MDVIRRITKSGLLLVSLCVSLSNQVAPTWNLPTANNLGVAENTAAGTPVFQVVATDLDGDAITYTETSGNAFFVINNAGVISVNAALDYETPPTTHTLAIQVTAGGDTISSNFAIDIIDQNEAPAFALPSYSLTAAEGQPYGTVLGNPGFTITDPDAGDTHICTMTCPTPGKFQMDKSAPYQVRFTSVYSLDAGDTNPTICDVKVIDMAGRGQLKLSATTSLTISITEANNYTPYFSVGSYNFDMSYFAGAGTEIAAAGVISANDEDTGTNGAITYSIDQTMLSPHQDYFSMNAAGRLTVNRAVDGSCNCPSTPLTFRVTATDGGGLTKTIPVTVLVGKSDFTIYLADREWQYTFFDDPKSMLWFVLALFAAFVTLVVGAFILYRYCCNYQKYYGGRDYHRHKERPDDDDDYYRPHKPRHDSPM